MHESILNKICIFAFIFYAMPNAVTVISQETTRSNNCQTPNNQSGICVPLSDCDLLLSLIKDNVSSEEKNFVRSSHCGFDTEQSGLVRMILVCCPRNTQTPEIFSTTRSARNENLLPEPGVCGKQFQDRIYGGVATNIDEYPWMALIKYKKSSNDLAFHCGGNLINSRYVLTAAHCIVKVPSTWTIDSVRLGEWDLGTNPDCDIDVRGVQDCADPYIDILVEKIIVHPQYTVNPREQYHDIALLRLNEIVQFTDFIKPICLPMNNEMKDDELTGELMDVAGWGVTETSSYSQKKLKINVKVWNITDCQKKFKHVNNSVFGAYQLCAGGDKGIDACRGDSGGALMQNRLYNNNKSFAFFAIGIVSYGANPCGLQDWPGVYTRVSSYVDWINNQIEP